MGIMQFNLLVYETVTGTQKLTNAPMSDLTFNLFEGFTILPIRKKAFEQRTNRLYRFGIGLKRKPLCFFFFLAKSEELR
jgi:hypothetical protein